MQLCILRSFAQNCPVNTEQLVWDADNLCPRSRGQRRWQELGVWAPLSRRWAPRKTRVWQVVNQNLTVPQREEGYGHPCVTGAWLDSTRVRMRRKVRKARLPSSAWCCWSRAQRQYSLNIGFCNGCGNGVWLMSFGASGSRLLPLHRRPASLWDCHAPRYLLSDRKREERKWSNQFSSPGTALFVCTGVGLLEQITLSCSRCSSKGCAVDQEVVSLLHKHRNWI